MSGEIQNLLGSDKKNRVLTGLLLAAVLLAYGNTLVNQFALDDELYILRNPQVTDPSLRAIFSLSPFSYVFRPVSFATLAFNWMLGGPQPAGYHLLNLLLHAGVTWLLFLLLQEVLRNVPEGRTIAFTAALLYAVHPIHTEAVTWAVGRMELLAAGFLFAGWLLHLRDRPIESLGCFALALLSKESAVAFFPLVVLGDYATGKWKPRVRYAMAGGLLLLYLAVLWKVQGGRLGRPDISMYDNMLAVLPANLRILNALRIGWKYVALQIYPAVLSCDYSFDQVTLYGDVRHTLAAVLASLAVFGAWIWALRKKWTVGVLAGGIYFAGFAATSNILVPTGTIMGERLAYLPSAGFCLLLALGWNWIRTRKETVAWGILAAVVLVFSARTAARNRDWKDAFTLYSSAVRAVPNDARMHANLAGQYFLRNDLDAAAHEYQIALRIIPDSPDTLATYAALEYQRGNYPAAETMMEKAVGVSNRNNINYDFMIATYAAILMKTNHAGQALEYLNREISESPSFAGAWSTRSDLHYQQGDLAAARADAESALRLDSRDPKAQQVLQMLNASGSSAAPQPAR